MFKKCKTILSKAFIPENCPTLAKFVFKIFNYSGLVVSEFKSDQNI